MLGFIDVIIYGGWDGIQRGYTFVQLNNVITEYFEEVEITREYDGYYYSVSEAVTIVILGSVCGLKNVNQIHQWAESNRVSEFLKEKFEINRIPSYYWLLCLLKLIKPDSLNRCFANRAYTFMPEKAEKLTIALDGKTVCSTVQMDKYENPLHIISAQLSELGITLAQKSVEGKSNEFVAVQKLLKEMNIKGTMIVAAALNLIKLYKSGTSSKKPMSKIMFDCLLNPRNILRILDY